MFQEAMTAIHAGDRPRARDLLTRLLQHTKENPEYWVWMSTVVDTTKERIYCLKEALRLDPQNASAKRGLSILGALPPDPALVLPAQYQHRNWQVRLPGEDSDVPAGPPKITLIAMGVAGLMVIGLVIFAIIAGESLFRRRRPLVINLPTSTATAVVAAAQTTPEPTRRTVRGGSPTPLSALLKETYTPTPMYVNTPHNSEAYRIALRAYQANDWGRAEAYFVQVATSEPGAVDIFYYLGEVYTHQKNPEKAIEQYDLAIETNPDFAPAYLGRARARLADDPKAVDEALEDLQSAAERDPYFGDVYLDMARIYIDTGEPEQALDAVDQASALLPDSPMVWLYRAEANLALGNDEEALEDAQHANQLDITLLSAYRMIGQVLQAQGDYEGSLQPLNTYLRYETEDGAAWYLLAQASIDAGKDDDALTALDKALKLSPRLTGAHIQRARLLLQKDRAEDALKDYEAALRVDPKSFEAVMGAGQALMALGYPGDGYNRFEEAKALAKTELEKAEQLLWRARSLEALTGYEDIAYNDYKKLLALPKTSVKSEWVTFAEDRIKAMATATPTSVKPTATPTGKATAVPSRTPTPTKKP